MKGDSVSNGVSRLLHNSDAHGLWCFETERNLRGGGSGVLKAAAPLIEQAEFKAHRNPVAQPLPSHRHVILVVCCFDVLSLANDLRMNCYFKKNYACIICTPPNRF